MKRETKYCMMIVNDSYKLFLFLLRIWGISSAFRTCNINPPWTTHLLAFPRQIQIFLKSTYAVILMFQSVFQSFPMNSSWALTSNLNKKNTKKVPPMLQVKADGESFFFVCISRYLNDETHICKTYQYPRWIIIFV